MADGLLEFHLGATKSLYETVIVRRPANKVLNRADECAYQLQNLRYWLGRWWARESGNVVARLLEQPVKFLLQLGKPVKDLELAAKNQSSKNSPFGNQVGQNLAETSRKHIGAQASLVEPF